MSQYDEWINEMRRERNMYDNDVGKINEWANELIVQKFGPREVIERSDNLKRALLGFKSKWNYHVGGFERTASRYREALDKYEDAPRMGPIGITLAKDVLDISQLPLGWGS